jgi:hypothetical protein
MKKKSVDDFTLGETIVFKGQKGFVTFIDHSYITYCIAETPLPPNIAKLSKRPTTQVNVLIFRQFWSDIESTTRLHQTDN